MGTEDRVLGRSWGAPRGGEAVRQAMATETTGTSPPSGGRRRRSAAEVAALLDKYAEQYRIPRTLAHRMMLQESSGNPRAQSDAGALGLLQLMPGTAREMGVTDPFDEEQSIRGGLRYLRKQYDDFGSWELALAAYNAGPGTIRQYRGVPPATTKVGGQVRKHLNDVLGASREYLWPYEIDRPIQPPLAYPRTTAGTWVPGSPLAYPNAGRIPGFSLVVRQLLRRR